MTKGCNKRLSWTRHKFLIFLYLGMLLCSAWAGAPLARVDLTPLLPPIIYATVGVPAIVNFENSILGSGLTQLVFKVECMVGSASAAQWHYTPRAEDVGVHAFTLSVFSAAGKKLAGASCWLHVSSPAKALVSPINLLLIGASQTMATHYPNRVAVLLDQYPGKGNWRMLGTHRTKNALPGVAHEGYGGKSWQWFASNYEDKPDGDYLKRSSPFVFLLEGRPCLDLDRYFKECNAGIKPDAIVFLIGINDVFSASADPDNLAEQKYQELFVNAEKLLMEFRRACPQAVFGLGLIPAPNRRSGAFEHDYKNKYTRAGWLPVWRELIKRQILFAQSAASQGAEIVPLHLCLDPEKDYPENNALHPKPEGYAKMGDVVYAWLCAIRTGRVASASGQASRPVQ